MWKQRLEAGSTFVEVLIVAGILVFLAAIGLTVSSPMREKARQSACISQLRQLHQAVLLYSMDVEAAEEVLGLGSLGCGAIFNGLKPLKPYLKNPSIRYCPDVPTAATERLATSYVWMPLPAYFFGTMTSGEQNLLAEQSRRIAREGLAFPMWLCRAHDEYYYQPQERDVSIVLAQPFIVEISVSGSVKSGRRPYRRTPPAPMESKR